MRGHFVQNFRTFFLKFLCVNYFNGRWYLYFWVEFWDLREKLKKEKDK